MQEAKRKYYEAYDERYKTAHAKGVSWETLCSTPIVLDTIRRFGIRPEQELLEIGCGEGRDAGTVLKNGYSLTATDISPEAIAYCRKTMPEFSRHFRILDCLSTPLEARFDFIYAVAVIHMLVPEEDRDGFYRFIHDHLNRDGLALICTMGDGYFEMQSDISRAFELQEREHPSGRMKVAGTSCRMVSFAVFEAELERNRFEILEKGITSAMPNFNSLMYAVIKRKPLTAGPSDGLPEAVR